MKGYRWAPKSWLGSPEVLTPNPLWLPSLNTKLLPDAALEVHLPGMDLRPMSAPDTGIGDYKSLLIHNTSSVNQWLYVEPVKKTEQDGDEVQDSFPNAAMLNGRSLAIITMTPQVIQPVEIALLVAVTDRSDWTVEIMNRVWIRREYGQREMKVLDSLIHKRSHREYSQEHRRAFMCGIDLDRHHRWRVDGMDPETRRRRFATNPQRAASRGQFDVGTQGSGAHATVQVNEGGGPPERRGHRSTLREGVGRVMTFIGFNARAPEDVPS